jgi:hypothetical protein
MHIFKYKFEDAIKLPHGAKILDVHKYGDTAFLWALVDPAASLQTRFFRMCATGEHLPRGAWAWKYITTAHDGGFVWHIFEIPNEDAL